MIRYIRPCLIAILFSALVGLPKSFGQTADAKLEGKWRMDKKSVLKELGSVEKEKYERMPKDIKKKFESSLGSKVFLFSKGGVFQADWDSGEKSESVVGNFKVPEEGMLSVVVNGQENRYLIERLTSSKLILFSQDNNGGILERLIFTRIPL